MLLRNRYVRCFVAAGVGALVAPKVEKLLNWAVPELTPAEGIINDIEFGSIIAVLAGVTAVLLSAAFGVPEGDSALPGSAPAKAPAAAPPPAAGGAA